MTAISLSPTTSTRPITSTRTPARLLATAFAASLLATAGLAAPAVAAGAPQPPDLFPITPPTATSVSGMEGVAYSQITVEYDECERADGRDVAFTLRGIPSGDGTTVSEPDGSAIRLSGPAVAEGSSLDYTVFGGTYRLGATAAGDDGAFAGVDITIPIDSETTVRTSELCDTGTVTDPPVQPADARPDAGGDTDGDDAGNDDGADAGAGGDAGGDDGAGVDVPVPTRIETGVGPTTEQGPGLAAGLGTAALLALAAGAALSRPRRSAEQ